MGVARGKPSVLTAVGKHIDLPLKENRPRGWEPYPICYGMTPNVDHMSFHISILSPGALPHEPHVHSEEEILIMLSGEAELIVIPENLTGKEQRYPITQGSLVYYPSFFRHTLHNVSSEPITYLMFKWRTVLPSGDDSPASVFTFDHKDLSELNKHQRPLQPRGLFAFPTRHLGKLDSHVTLLQPGAGYAPHRDDHDVAIVLLKGTIETLNKRLEPLSVVYCSSGELHGMKNVGTVPAYYLVLEFHAGPNNRAWLKSGLQLWRVLRSPIKDLPKTLGVFLAHRRDRWLSRMKTYQNL